MASNPSVDIEMEFTKRLTAGFFGGEGFVLQKLSGQGDVLVKAGGALIERELEEGEVLRVTSGSLVGFTSTVQYDVQMMPGVKNAMFGGEGLFVTTLTGPGKIWLQGMPPNRMISEIARRVPAGGSGMGMPIFVGGTGGGGEAAGEAAGDGAAAAASGAATTGMAEGVSASGMDGDIMSDRQATVATSDVGSSATDAGSPSALFGDAAPEDSTVQSDPGQEPQFADDTSFSTSDSDQSGDGFWSDDQTTTEGLGSMGTGEETADSSSIFSTLWDLVSGDD